MLSLVLRQVTKMKLLLFLVASSSFLFTNQQRQLQEVNGFVIKESGSSFRTHSLCSSVVSLSLSSTSTNNDYDNQSLSSQSQQKQKRRTELSSSETTGEVERSEEQKSSRVCRARDMMIQLVDDQCFTTIEGAGKFTQLCSDNIVYEDCYEQKLPFVGKKNVSQNLLNRVLEKRIWNNSKTSIGVGRMRIDKITDGDVACGFAWTFVNEDNTKEGLRGTTFVELDKETKTKIVFVREIPEPIFKPGNLLLNLLKLQQKNKKEKSSDSDSESEPEPASGDEQSKKTMTAANEIAKYLYTIDMGSDESMVYFDENIVYRDFNYENVFRGPNDVRNFFNDYKVPGITFTSEKFDDGESVGTCATWNVRTDGMDDPNDSIRGITLYELSSSNENKKIKYVRNVAESSIKPPPLGKLARLINPELGIFGDGYPIGSRLDGM